MPKVIESIRPLVLPKLREEKERITKKKSKKKAIKDVIVSGKPILYVGRFVQRLILLR